MRLRSECLLLVPFSNTMPLAQSVGTSCITISLACVWSTSTVLLRWSFNPPEYDGMTIEHDGTGSYRYPQESYHQSHGIVSSCLKGWRYPSGIYISWRIPPRISQTVHCLSFPTKTFTLIVEIKSAKFNPVLVHGEQCWYSIHVYLCCGNLRTPKLVTLLSNYIICVSPIQCTIPFWSVMFWVCPSGHIMTPWAMYDPLGYVMAPWAITVSLELWQQIP